ncbi:Transposon Ty3-I Gag-Pol polyprotein OS=Saccharomyces cerevisiae (strain ATCC 204508 / S288c) GN=TY3B-I PE=3 SV=2 [Rhizoctonia solani AG-1 IB]|uniref:Transposon Ty3-I Gag-Pol polyprotein n=1 Tax=Thanatephorus cucumeris (strain AG1-IB / isolate 7/3/14) TaxID=1108050 RepID=A0A0B7FRS7_THACB|nr:Transposon Ty3-I Gag-Pol polyprotein OS=Saccharomyces cerevisiae (strain ATCC 204508 / S288c) GN=TY3B-I PE=3 SV=2 [Rhizoctonia solani AG-1 IB]
MFVYLDDVVIFSDTLEEHVAHIRTVLKVLKREKLFLSPNKMQFLAEDLHILGHIVDSKGIRMDPHKVDSVSKWKTPESKEQLASFLGAVGYLAPNCPGIRIPMAPLAKRASGHTPFRWGGLEERSFREVIWLVEEYRGQHCVALEYGPDAPPIYLITDASLTGASRLVSQGPEWQTASVAAFWLAKFSNAQQNYTVTEREALAIVASLDKFQPLLHGVKFEILTDHKALEFLLTQKTLNARQIRWLETIGQFDCTIRYIEGTQNILADALSRMYSEDKQGTERAESEYVPEREEDRATGLYARLETVTRPVITGMAAKVAAESQITSESVRRNPARTRAAPKRYDPEIPGRGNIENARKRAPKATQANNGWDPDRRDEFEIAREEGRGADEMTNNSGQMKSSPASAELEGGSTHNATLDTESEKCDPTDRSDHRHITRLVREIDVTKAIAEGYSNDKDYAKIIEEPSQYPQFELRDELLFYNEHGRSYLCVPDAMIDKWSVRALLISQAHSMVAHLGYKKTYAYMRESLYWKGMGTDTKKFCSACVSCASSKTPTQKPYGLLKPLPVPKYPWAQIGVDFLGPLTESNTLLGTFDMVCVVIDHLTCMVHLIPTRSDYTAKDMAEVFHANIFRLHGVPEIIISDRDKLFTSIFWRTLFELVGTELRFSSAFHPQTDGLTERMICCILGLLRTCMNPALRDWALKLPSIEFAVNAARSETTGFSPFVLNYGRVPRPMLVRTDTDMYGVREAARNIKYALMIAHDAIIGAHVSQMVESNRHQRPSPFKVGDLVYVNTKNMRVPMGKPHKLLAQWIGPVLIDGVVKEGATYHVELPEDLKRRGIKAIFHASLLKPHIPYEDRRFPGRNYKQIASLEADDNEWAVEKIAGHRGKGSNAMFEIVWQTGDRTWETYRVVRHLEALKQYFEALGIKRAKDLPWKEDGDIPYDELSDSGSETLEGACMRVLKDENTSLETTIAKSLNHLACLTEYPLITLHTSCTTADADAEAETATATETTADAAMTRRPTTPTRLSGRTQACCDYSTPSPRPAWKPSERGIRNAHDEATEEALPARHAMMSTTRISGDVRWTSTKVLSARTR